MLMRNCENARMGLTGDRVQEHEVLEVGDFAPLPLLGHVGGTHQLTGRHHGSASRKTKSTRDIDSSHAVMSYFGIHNVFFFNLINCQYGNNFDLSVSM